MIYLLNTGVSMSVFLGYETIDAHVNHDRRSTHAGQPTYGLRFKTAPVNTIRKND